MRCTQLHVTPAYLLLIFAGPFLSKSIHCILTSPGPAVHETRIKVTLENLLYVHVCRVVEKANCQVPMRVGTSLCVPHFIESSKMRSTYQITDPPPPRGITASSLARRF